VNKATRSAPHGRVILALVLEFISRRCPLVAAVDDTLNRKTGKRVWAAGMYHDSLLSTARRAVFPFGHGWVVLSLQVRFAFAPAKVWSLPFLMRLYRCNQNTGALTQRRTAALSRGTPGNAPRRSPTC
jgi:hypothetical protein